MHSIIVDFKTTQQPPPKACYRGPYRMFELVGDVLFAISKVERFAIATRGAEGKWVVNGSEYERLVFSVPSEQEADDLAHIAYLNQRDPNFRE